MRIQPKTDAKPANHSKRAQHGQTHPKSFTRKNTQKFSFIKRLDFLGGRFTFNLPSSPSGAHQTALGGYITLTLSFLILVVFIPIFSQFVNTKSPKVTTSTEISPKNPVTFNLNKEELFIPLSVNNAFRFIKDYQRFASIKLRIIKTAYDASREFLVDTLLYEFDYVLCESLDHPGMNEMMETVKRAAPGARDASLCPDYRGKESEVFISENERTLVVRKAEIALYPCSLEDSTQCAKPSEMAGFTLTYGVKKKLLRSEDYKNPVATSIVFSFVKLNTLASKFMTMAVGRTKVFDDRFEVRGETQKVDFSTMEIVQEDLDVRNAAQIHCTAEEVRGAPFSGCLPYASIIYNVKRDVVMVNRRYKRLTAILGEFGGMLKLLTTLIFFLYRFYNREDIRTFFGGAFFWGGDRRRDVDDGVLRGLLAFEDADEGRFSRLGSREGDGGRRQDVLIGKGMEANLSHFSHFDQKGGTADELEVIDLRQNGQNSQNGNNEDLRKIAGSDKIRTQEVVDECVSQRTCAVDLIDKLNFVEFLQQAVMDDHEKILPPLALLKAKQNQLKQKNFKKVKISGFQKNEIKALKNEANLSLEQQNEPIQLPNRTESKNKKRLKKGKKRKRKRNQETELMSKEGSIREREKEPLTSGRKNFISDLSEEREQKSSLIYIQEEREKDELADDTHNPNQYSTIEIQLKEETQRPRQQPNLEKTKLERGEKTELGYREAYEQLKASEPSQSLKKLMKGYILGQLGPFFESWGQEPRRVDQEKLSSSEPSNEQPWMTQNQQNLNRIVGGHRGSTQRKINFFQEESEKEVKN